MTQDTNPGKPSGANHQSGSIVAVALAGENAVDLYIHDGERVSTVREDFAPWLIVNRVSARSFRRVSAMHLLGGDGFFDTLVTFDSWSSWRDVYRSLRDAESTHVLAFPNPADQYLIMSGRNQFEGMEIDQVRRAQVDIETTGLDPHAPDAALIMIAAAINGQDAVVLRADQMSETDMLRALDDWIDVNDPDVIEGHNIYNFDIPYLAARASAHNIQLNWGRDGSPVRIGGTRRFKAGARVIPFDQAYVRGRHFIDTYQQIQRYDYAGLLQSYGLKESITALGLERSNRQHVEGAAIQRVWAEDPDRLAEYAIDDLRDVDELSRLTLPTEFYQARILPSSLQDVAIGGPGEKVNDLLLRAYISQRESIPAPRSPRSYPGGYLEVRHTGRFSPVVKCDVESLYPAIMLSDRIAPASDHLGVFLPLLQELTTERLTAKRRAAASTGHEHARWNGLQSSLKVLINSFYGYLGYSRGYFNDYEAAERVTLRGHDIIQHVTRLLEEEGATTIEIDTDGVYFQPMPEADSMAAEESLIDRVSSHLPEGINLAHDGRWKAMLSLKLKNYALLGHDGGLYLKGSSLRSRRDEPYLRRFIEAAARAFLAAEGDATVRDLYLNTASDLMSGEVAPEMIARTETITEQTFRSQSTRRLAEAIGSERIGERVMVYQRESGDLARLEAYANDEDRSYLLRRLRAAAERFRPLYTSAESFEYDFPVVTLRTDLEALRSSVKADQMRLF